MELEFDESEIQEFKTESSELLDDAEKHLLDLDSGGEFKANYDAIFRVFHSLKGASGMIGMTDLQGHMHILENHLTDCKAKGEITKPQITYYLEGVDAARTLLDGDSVSFTTPFPGEGDAATAPAPQPQPESATAPAPAAASTEKPSEEKAPVASKSPAAAGTVYVVDDEKDIVEILTETLQEAFFEVEAFGTAEELLTRLKTKKPDVVVTDMKMPHMNGFELLKSIHAIDPDLPVIFQSAHISKELLLESINHGLFAAIEKPFSGPAVIAHCLNATRRYRLLKLLNRTIDFIMFQFSDLDDYLVTQGKVDVRNSMKNELSNLLEQRRELKRFAKMSKDQAG